MQTPKQDSVADAKCLQRGASTAVLWEVLPAPGEDRGTTLLPTIELNLGTPVEELGEGLKEMKVIAAPYEEQYQLTGPWRDPMD